MSMTMSDDELMLMEEQARKLTILDLKKLALTAKQAGDVQQAMENLKQAKKIENEERRRQRSNQNQDQEDDNFQSYATTLPIFWIKVAILCKQSGDINKAKEALMYSKELEKQKQNENEQQQQENNENGVGVGGVEGIAGNNEDAAATAAAAAAAAAVAQEEIIPPPQQSSPQSQSQSHSTINEQAASAPPVATPVTPSAPIVVVDDDDNNNNIEPPPPSYENIVSSTTVEISTLLPPSAPPPPPPPSYENIINNSPNSATIEKKNEDAEIIASEEEAAMLDRFRKKKEEDVVPDDVVEVQEVQEVIAVVIAVSFTDEEMMDEEMMIELSELSGGDDVTTTTTSIPTQEEYASKVLEYKKLALKYKKEGDIPKAMQHLQQAKQLEKVGSVLKSMNRSDGLENDTNQQQQNGLSLNWMDTLNPEESDLLGELFDDNNNNNNNKNSGGCDTDYTTTGAAATTTGTTSTDRLTIEDIDDMDDDNDIIELVEMMGDNINALPTVEELTIMITEHQQNALKYKQDGDIESAKQSLILSKKAKLQAMRLAEIYRKLEIRKQQQKNNGTGGDDRGGEDDSNEGSGNEEEEPISMDALEALMDGSHLSSVSSPTPAPKPKAVIDPWLLKPSIEIKEEVIRLKNIKHVKEATRLLQLFKQKVVLEQKEIEIAKCSKMVDMIQQRINISEIQIKLWQYYTWFGNEESSSVGKTQYVEWIKFQKDCQKAINTINTEGSNSVTISPRAGGDDVVIKKKKKMYTLEDDVISLVESCTNDNDKSVTTADDDDASSYANGSGMTSLDDNSLEVAVMGLFDMDKNEKLQKILTKQQPKSNIKKKAPAATGMSSSSTSAFPPNLKVNAKLQLPVYPDDPSKPVYMDFQPSHSSLSRSGRSSSFKYDFDPTSTLSRQQIVLPRKDPKQERTLLRRIETKTIQLSIFYDTHNQKLKPQDAIAATEAAKKEATAAANAAAASKKKSWFFGKGKEPEPSSKENGGGSGGGVDDKDIFLGKVTIEFNQLISRGCITGDYPIMTNAKSLGGILRVAIRTKPALDPDKYEGVLPLISVEDDDDGSTTTTPSSSSPPSPSISTYKKGLSFTFNNKTKSDDGDGDDDEKTSIAAIKRESTSASSSSQEIDTSQKAATTTKAK